MNTYFNVFSKKRFITEGKERTTWYKIGYVKMSAQKGSFLVLHQQPDTTFHLFESTESGNLES